MEKKILFLGSGRCYAGLGQKVCRRGRYAQHRQANEAGDIFPIGNSIPASDCRSLDCHRQRCRIRTNGVPSLMVKHLGEDLDHWHTSFDRNEVLCETMWDVGKRLGKKVALINWPVTFPMGAISEEDGCQLAGSLNPPFRYFFMPLWDVASSACFSNQKLRCQPDPRPGGPARSPTR